MAKDINPEIHSFKKNEVITRTENFKIKGKT